MLQCVLVDAGTTGGRQSLHQERLLSSGGLGGVSDRPGLTTEAAMALGVAVPTSASPWGQQDVSFKLHVPPSLQWTGSILGLL